MNYYIFATILTLKT